MRFKIINCFHLKVESRPQNNQFQLSSVPLSVASVSLKLVSYFAVLICRSALLKLPENDCPFLPYFDVGSSIATKLV